MANPLRLPSAPPKLADVLARGGAVAWSEPVTMTTYEPAEPDEYPMFFDRRVYQGSSGRVYPIPFIDRVATDGHERAWAALHLENRWIRLMILPELGGRIHVGYDKVAGYDFFYRNNVIKPALVGLAGPWISGGVEFNWPQHHRPATFLPVETAIEEHDDGAVTVWCSDHDPFTRMKGMHGVRLRPDRAAVELVVRLHNRTSETHTFLWWANVAVRVHEKYQSFFPPDVRYVADHARRAITAFPAADRPYYGVDYPARAGRGGDRIDWQHNIPVPTSYMVTDTRGEFFGGYDHDKAAGFVHVADRHIAPGKKMWTWGNAAFGDAWHRLLTDDDGPYIELMAGAYTDNQPDFAWIAPGETKTFTQTWYPIHRIGPVQQATTEAALQLTAADGRVRVGVCCPSERPAARLRVRAAGRVVLDELVDLAPGRPFTTEFEASGDVTVTVTDGDTELIHWCSAPTGPVSEPWTATEPPAPEAVPSADELYLTGLHLAQYRHPTRSPLPYWREALRRDPGDARCNLAVADDAYRRADYLTAETHVRRALRRLTVRNANPRDGEVSYLLGLILTRTGREEEAYAAFAKATWNAAYVGPASVELARLDGRAGRWASVLTRADAALAAQRGDSRARGLRVIALRALGRSAEAARDLDGWLAVDPLDQLALTLAGHEGSTDARTGLDVAGELAAAGDHAGALAVLARSAARPPTAAGNLAPLAHYHRAHLYARLGQAEEAAAARRDARAVDAARCFPCTLDDHDALRAALDADPDDARAAALLGMLLMDRGRQVEALALWQRAVDTGLADHVTLRNAAIAIFHTTGDASQALRCYDDALARKPSTRLLYERDQLHARIGTPVDQRLALVESFPGDLQGRDDLTVEYCRLLVDNDRAGEAVEILTSRPFAPWEGGEGRVISAWEQAHLRLVEAAEAQGDLEAAVSLLRQAIEIPENLGEARHPLTDTRVLHAKLADVLDTLGRADEARRIRASATIGEAGAVTPAGDEPTDYFATSLPDLLLFARTARQT
jgi:tetratricopeptide (TPR) repeat protein